MPSTLSHRKGTGASGLTGSPASCRIQSMACLVMTPPSISVRWSSSVSTSFLAVPLAKSP